MTHLFIYHSFDLNQATWHRTRRHTDSQEKTHTHTHTKKIMIIHVIEITIITNGRLTVKITGYCYSYNNSRFNHKGKEKYYSKAGTHHAILNSH